MQNLVSMRAFIQEIAYPDLKAVWYVDADSTYFVTKRDEMQDIIVAIRTLAGLGRLELRDGTIHLLKEGSLLLINKSRILNYAADSKGWQFYWFEFENQEIALGLMNRIVMLPVSPHEQYAMERCFLSLNRNNAYECAIAESMFTCLLGDWQLRTEPGASRGMPASELLDILEEGHREHSSVEELARKAGMCERSFRNAVQKATGFAPKAYMLRREMTAAMELLKTSTMTVAEISSLFHYKNPFYFSRVFKKHYGTSPQHIRMKEK